MSAIQPISFFTENSMPIFSAQASSRSINPLLSKPFPYKKINQRNIACYIREESPHYLNLSIKKQASTHYKKLLAHLKEKDCSSVIGLNLRNNKQLNLKNLTAILKKFTNVQILDLSNCPKLTLSLNLNELTKLPKFEQVTKIFIHQAKLSLIKNIHHCFPKLQTIHCSGDYRIWEMKETLIKENSALLQLNIGNQAISTYRAFIPSTSPSNQASMAA